MRECLGLSEGEMVGKRCNNSCGIARLSIPSLFGLILLSTACVAGSAQSLTLGSLAEGASNREAADKGIASPGIPGLVTEPRTAPPAPSVTDPPIERAKLPKPKRVDWKGVLNQSAFFLGIEQGYRLGTQPGTRNALKGEFFDDWFTSVAATHGWGDADDFLANYIGHPMQGSVTGNIYVQNDPRGRALEFSWESKYWTSRLKATAWSALYSTQFELGPVSEASIGNVGYPGQSLSGYVDLVITPVAGLGWQVGEDALDKYLIMKIEDRTSNPVILMLVRSFLNPTRSFANMMRLRLPWNRELRPGIWKNR
jgi:hypothetical protein